MTSFKIKVKMSIWKFTMPPYYWSLEKWEEDLDYDQVEHAMPLVTKVEIHEECLKEWTYVTKMIYQHQGLELYCNMVPNLHLFPIQIQQQQLADLNYKPVNQGFKTRLTQYNSILRMNSNKRIHNIEHIARFIPNQCQ